ncbi:MAG: succinate dehydrogenase, hydrophobic membrane anchor protein [Alphaproteobacteria bacterium]
MKDKTCLRAPLGVVRGHGSARSGTAHWWGMRLTALALVFLCGWFVVKLLFCMQGGAYDPTVAWLRHPINATLMCLLLVVGFHHTANGLQTVIEDYIHCPCGRTFGIISVKFVSVLLAGIGIFAVGKIAFGS